MEVKEWLDEVAYIGDMNCGFDDEPSRVYLSKFDGSYITHVGMEESVKFLADRGITQELTHGVGFSPNDGKWYGWSHRAIYGFTIGSKCEKGDCHYVANTPEELIEDHAMFFSDFGKHAVEQRRAECQILDDRSGIRILTTPVKMPVVSSLNDLERALDDPDSIPELPEETLFDNDHYIIKCGRGEWTAETMEDARQMAIDFNEGVSR